MDAQAKLDELTELVENAKSMPLSASVLVNKADVLAMLDELRAALPDELREAQWVIKDRDEVIEQGRKEAERIIAEGRTEAARLVSRTEVMQTATKEAERVLEEARENARRMRLEVEDYVDAKLANFEVVLHKTLGAVERGRDKLRGRHELEELREGGALLPDEPPLPG
jgi:regulator of protease activity HflC (stomatin/prohibitin superfamily)